MKKICKNCKLFNPNNKICQVIILYEGEKINIPVDPQDSCFFEQPYYDPISKKKEDFNEIKEIKMWVEDEFGQKSNTGKVRIEYPKELDIQRD